jgi:hypothetical protein
MNAVHTSRGRRRIRAGLVHKSAIVVGRRGRGWCRGEGKVPLLDCLDKAVGTKYQVADTLLTLQLC